MLFSKSPEQKIKKVIAWIRSLKINVSADPDEIKGMTRLDLSFRGIAKLPEEIGFLENLTDLNLSNNELKNLPKELSKMANLRSLNLGYNLFTSMPDEIFQFRQLETLNMEANLIKSMPSSIGNLSNLKNVNLFANKISSLPAEFCKLGKLASLNMALNQLSKLPSSFGSLTNIVELELWLNRFELIPDVVSKLPKLKDSYHSFDTDKLNKALIMAVFSNNKHLAEKLIFHGADVNFRLNGFRSQLFTTPLFEAKSPEMIDLLLKNGADPNLKREIIKYVFSKNGSEEIRKTGKSETFLTIRHPEVIDRYIKSLNIIPGAEKAPLDNFDDIF
jgi:Leucine-rich repeat (LRR) protein